MYCPKCGKKQPEGAVFCGDCGAKINVEMDRGGTSARSFDEERGEPSRAPLVIGLVAVVLLLAAAGVFAALHFSKGDGEDMVANQDTFIGTDMEGVETVENAAGDGEVDSEQDQADEQTPKEEKGGKKKKKDKGGSPVLNDPDAFFFPDSDARLIGETELEKLSAKERTYARNEIYARHGYVFQSPELNGYFQGKNWYMADTSCYSSTVDILLNDTEKKNAEMMLSYQIATDTNYMPVDPTVKYEDASDYHSVDYDLTQGGKADRIEFSANPPDDGYHRNPLSVFVNGNPALSIDDYFFYYDYKLFHIKDDAYLFVATHSENEDGIRMIYRYDQGGFVLERDLIDDAVDNMHFGAYFVKAKKDGVVMKVWAMGAGAIVSYNETYQYENGHLKLKGNTFDLIRGPESQTVRTKQEIPIFEDADCTKSAGSVPAGMDVEVTKTHLMDGRVSYYIEGMGWYVVDADSFKAEELFEGFYYAG